MNRRRILTSRTLSLCFVSIAFAIYLLFWFFESIGPRMDVVNEWSIEHHVLVFDRQAVNVREDVTHPLFYVDVSELNQGGR